MRKLPCLIALLLSIGGLTLTAGELQLIVAPRATTVSADGYIRFDVYLYNGSDNLLEAPAPEAEFNVNWTLRDPDRLRPDRSGSDFVLGTDTVKHYRMKPGTAIKRELGDRVLAEPGDIVEFFISVERKSRSGKTETIRSNVVSLHRPKQDDSQK